MSTAEQNALREIGAIIGVPDNAQPVEYPRYVTLVVRNLEWAKADVKRLKAAIREHRDQKADNRCWLDDAALYQALGGTKAETQLPPECEFLESCRRYWKQRQAPLEHGGKPGDMTMRQLQDRIARLETVLSAGANALRSYQYGNSAGELAESIADECFKALREGDHPG